MTRAVGNISSRVTAARCGATTRRARGRRANARAFRRVGTPRRAVGDAARDARARFDDEGDARTRRGRELELAFESATTGAAEAWERGRDAGDDEDARERDARDAEDEYERIAARMEARMAMAFEALEARARRARERETGSSSSDGERARANASEATRRLEELEDRLRSATTTLRATHEELERERKRCAELDAALARARDSTTAAFGEKIQTTRELAEAVAALEGEKADAMHERARLLERMDALERDGVVDGAVMNENLRIELANERAKRGALEEALTDLKLASDASMELSVALRQEVEALRSSGAQPSVSLIQHRADGRDPSARRERHRGAFNLASPRRPKRARRRLERLGQSRIHRHRPSRSRRRRACRVLGVLERPRRASPRRRRRRLRPNLLARARRFRRSRPRGVPRVVVVTHARARSSAPRVRGSRRRGIRRPHPMTTSTLVQYYL